MYVKIRFCITAYITRLFESESHPSTRAALSMDARILSLLLCILLVGPATSTDIPEPSIRKVSHVIKMDLPGGGYPSLVRPPGTLPDYLREVKKNGGSKPGIFPL